MTDTTSTIWGRSRSRTIRRGLSPFDDHSRSPPRRRSSSRRQHSLHHTVDTSVFPNQDTAWQLLNALSPFNARSNFNGTTTSNRNRRSGARNSSRFVPVVEPSPTLVQNPNSLELIVVDDHALLIPLTILPHLMTTTRTVIRHRLYSHRL